MKKILLSLLLFLSFVSTRYLIAGNSSAIACTVNAGVDQTICNTNAANLSGSIGTSAGPVLWTTTGDGSFVNAALLNTTYTPGVNDIANGNVMLTLTNNDPSCVPTPISDDIYIYLSNPPTANAGSNFTTCANNIYLTGSYSYAGGVVWTTSGTGTFNGTTYLYPLYYPSVADTTFGSVVLTLTTTGNGACPAASSQITVTILSIPFVDAGVDQDLCNAATATLAANTPKAGEFGAWSNVYAPTGPDVNNPTAVINIPLATDNISLMWAISGPNGCSNADDMVINNHGNAVINAGNDTLLACMLVDTVYMNNLVGFIDQQQVTWKALGSSPGKFKDIHNPIGAYAPSTSDKSTGFVNIKIDAAGYGACLAASDTILVKFGQPAVSNAGPDKFLCTANSNAINLSAAPLLNGESGVWTIVGVIGCKSCRPAVQSGNGSVYPLSIPTASYTLYQSGVEIDTLVWSVSNGYCSNKYSTNDTMMVGARDQFYLYDDTIHTLSNKLTTLDVIQNDGFYWFDTITVSLPRDTSVVGGSITSAGNKVSFTSANGYIGNDSCVYVVSNTGQCIVDSATIRVVVKNAPPIANTDLGAVTANTINRVVVKVLQNDVDVNKNISPPSLRIISQPVSGAIAAVYGDSIEIDYVSNNAKLFTGVDSLHYVICDTYNGCDTGVVRILVLPNSVHKRIIEVYNVVSPNGDLLHDFLEIGAINDYTNCIVTIYDRWGNRVFILEHYDNFENKFVGKSNIDGHVGEDLPDGTYYYSVTDGSTTLDNGTGYLELKR